MFWLFRRKKVADKKNITPCVCDDGEEMEDSFILREFSSPISYCRAPRSISDGALTRLSRCEKRGVRKGYHRLQGEGVLQEEETNASSISEPICQTADGQETIQPRITNTITTDCETISSSTDYSDDYTGFNSDSYDDDDLTCNVCDRSFFSVRHLLHHQQKKRHYGCSICDSIFQNLMALELHKETLDHWSNEELRYGDTDSEDDKSYENLGETREHERLL